VDPWLDLFHSGCRARSGKMAAEAAWLGQYVAACFTAKLSIAAMSFHLFESLIVRPNERFEYNEGPIHADAPRTCQGSV